MSEAPPRISIAILCFNEEETLAETVRRTHAALTATGETFEILVIDDGSTDASPEIAAALERELPHVRLLRHPRNLGIGEGLVSGYRETRGEWTGILPADLQFAPEDLPAVLARRGDADVVAVYRQQRHDPWQRSLISAIDRLLVRALFGLRCRDLHWFKLYRRGVLDGVTITRRTPMVDTELLIKAKRSGARIVEMPLSHQARRHGEAKGAKLSTIVRTLMDLISLRLLL